MFIHNRRWSLALDLDKGLHAQCTICTKCIDALHVEKFRVEAEENAVSEEMSCTHRDWLLDTVKLSASHGVG